MLVVGEEGVLVGPESGDCVRVRDDVLVMPVVVIVVVVGGHAAIVRHTSRRQFAVVRDVVQPIEVAPEGGYREPMTADDLDAAWDAVHDATPPARGWGRQ